VGLLGSRDSLLRLLEENLAADIHVRGNRVTLRGSAEDVAFAERTLRELLALQESGSVITPDTVRRTIGILADPAPGGAPAESPSQILTLNILSRRGRTIRPKTLGQKRYVDSIDQHTIVFGIGPAGTGKTYLAMAKAVQSLQAKQVNRIILTRPAVEAGERLGFLPGTLFEKIDPYLRPLYDALRDRDDTGPLPGAALGRADRDGRPGPQPPADAGRHHRGRPAGLHARAHPQRRVHHPGRGTEHLHRTDEDVPHPPGVRLQDRGHRRHHPGGPARRPGQRP